jgi:predicted ABC-type transport system involved in lysophospholipase L1 biosynthesis ATPase subunit
MENVKLPILLQGRRRQNRAMELLDAVGLALRFGNKLHELSGGDQQRVAIAIALANQLKLLLADEPTGSVDSKMANQTWNTRWWTKPDACKFHPATWKL